MVSLTVGHGSRGQSKVWGQSSGSAQLIRGRSSSPAFLTQHRGSLGIFVLVFSSMKLWDRNPTRALMVEIPVFDHLSFCFLFVKKILGVAQRSPGLARIDTSMSTGESKVGHMLNLP